MKESRDRIPDKGLREIFPKKLCTHRASEGVYSELKKMILSGKVKKRPRLIREKIAQDLNVS
jgi:DNA-binding GntR family transcriptional regulator